MSSFIGEYGCKADAKGRFLLPTGLLKQFSPELRDRMILSRSIFQPCLILYPRDTWSGIMDMLSKLNRFVKENDDFIRLYTNGAMEVELDNSGRILIPRRLMDYAGIKADMVLASSIDKVEVWADERYNNVMNQYAPDAFAQLAERVMGNISTGNSM